jgi:hypothetical protein
MAFPTRVWAVKHRVTVCVPVARYAVGAASRRRHRAVQRLARNLENRNFGFRHRTGAVMLPFQGRDYFER